MLNGEAKRAARGKTYPTRVGENAHKSEKLDGAVADRDAERIDVDVVQDAIGDFGWWQARVCVCLSLLKLPVAWHQLSIVFLAPPPGDYFCSDGGFNATNDLTSQNGSLIMPDMCHYYRNESVRSKEDEIISSTLVPCQKWTYDHSTFEETIISEWDLVCDRSQFSNVAQTSFMFGILLGNVLFGMWSDKIGRKIPLLTAIALQTVTGISTAYIPWFSGFLVLRFLLAFATGGTMMTSFVICMEIVGGWWRTAAPVLYHIPFSIGHCSLSAFAYQFRHWRDFQLAISLPSILLLSYWWLIPESPRWLLATGHYSEAKEVLSAAAKTNGRTWDKASKSKLDIQHTDNEVKTSAISTGERNSLEAASTNNVSEHKQENTPKKSKASILDLLRTPNLRCKTLIATFNWLIGGLGFFGIAQYMGRIGGDIFINVAIAGAIETPGTLACIFAMSYFGRRNTLMGSQLLAGFSCLLLLCVPNGMEWLLVTLSAIGLIGMSIVFPTNYLYTAELFPTVVRNAGVGAASMCARIGSMIAPFITTLDTFSPVIPPITFGTFPLVAGLLALLLPETLNQRLPDTIQEGEDFGKKKPRDPAVQSDP